MKSHIVRIMFISIVSVVLGWIVSVPVHAQSSEDSFFYGEENITEPSSFANVIQQDVVQSNDGVVKKILRVFKLDQFTTLSDTPALEFAKYILNIALGLVSFIALGVIIYGFVQVLFAKDEEGITNAKKIIKNTAIAIAIIGVSRLVVLFLFSLYASFVGTP